MVYVCLLPNKKISREYTTLNIKTNMLREQTIPKIIVNSACDEYDTERINYMFYIKTRYCSNKYYWIFIEETIFV